MHLTLLTADTQYARAIVAMAGHQNLKFKSVIIVKRSMRENLRIVKNVIKRVGLSGLSYYLRQKHIEESYLRLKLDRIGYEPLAFYLQNIPVTFTTGCNSKQTAKAIQISKPDILVLGQVGILGQHILNIPKYGTINGHTGLLPKYRGYTDPAHMIIDNDHRNIGVSVHWVNDGVDTGPVISTEKYRETFKPLSINELLADLRYKAAKLLIDTIKTNEGYTPRYAKEDSKLCFLLPVHERKIAQKLYQELPLDCFSPTK